MPGAARRSLQREDSDQLRGGHFQVVVGAGGSPACGYTRSMTYKVGPKGQVVIPKGIRDRVGIGPGDEVSFDEDHGTIQIRKAVTSPTERRAILERLRGSLKGGEFDPIAGLEAEHRREVEVDECERRVPGC